MSTVVEVARCTTPEYNWTYNSLGLTPCEVFSSLGNISVGPLDQGNHYILTELMDKSDSWACSSVSYSLISACTACQGEAWDTYTNWVINCTSPATNASFPPDFEIPDGVRVPKWAFRDFPTYMQTWDNDTAIHDGDTPESIGIFIATAESPQVTTSIIESDISTVGGISTIDTFNPQATVIGLSSSSNSRMSQSSCISVVAGVLIGVVSALASVCLL